MRANEYSYRYQNDAKVVSNINTDYHGRRKSVCYQKPYDCAKSNVWVCRKLCEKRWPEPWE